MPVSNLTAAQENDFFPFGHARTPLGVVKSTIAMNLATSRGIIRNNVAKVLFNQPSEFQETFKGDVYKLPSDTPSSIRLGVFAGTHEADEIALLQSLRPAQTIIELGAHFGVFARHAFAKLKNGGLYVAVEASPRMHDALTVNMRETKRRYPGRDFRVVAAAVGDPANDGKMVSFSDRKNLSSGLVGHIRADRVGETVAVQSTSLSALIRSYAPKNAPVTVTSDIEGAEIILCEKDRNAFDRVDQIAIELHGPKVTGRPVEISDMLACFDQMGFRRKAETPKGSCYLLSRLDA